jgi:hypothetical protein
LYLSVRRLEHMKYTLALNHITNPPRPYIHRSGRVCIRHLGEAPSEALLIKVSAIFSRRPL